jgi:maltokinase
VTNPATTLPPTPAEFHPDLERFIGTARWFGGKGRPFRVTGVRRAGELGGEPPARAVVELVSVTYDDKVGGVELYQVPLSLRSEPEERLEHAFVGRWDDLYVYDAVHDREAMALWLSAFSGAADVDPDLVFHRSSDEVLDLTAHAAMLTAEQSNSSIAFGEQSLMKIFRRVTPGVNPDIQVHDVLTRAGCDHVAALYGWLDVPGDTPTGSVIQLAMLQQFLRTASDGWELARASVRNLFAEADLHAHEVGGDFAAEAARLGTARRPHRPAHPWRPPPRADAADGQGLEARRLRGRAGTGTGRPPAARLGLARCRRHAPLLRLRRAGRPPRVRLRPSGGA